MCYVSWKLPTFLANFHTSLNIVSSVLLQLDHITKYLLFTCSQFCEKLTWRSFWLYANPGDANTQHLLRLSGIGQMPLHKCRNTIWCAMCIERPRWGRGRGGAHGPLGSNNPAARRRHQAGLVWFKMRQISFGDVSMINMTKIYVFNRSNRVSCLSEAVRA